MLHAMRSNSLNAEREACVEAAYNKLDRNGNQNVTIGDLEDNYDCSINPEFVNGWKGEAQLREEFRQSWDTISRDTVVSLSEFLDFYKDVSPTVTKDEFFTNMLRNTWHF